jgi:hypothetical protein
MDDLQKKRDEVYKGSSDFVKAMYEDAELGGVLGKLIGEFGLTGEKISQFIHIYGDVILGIYQSNQIDSKLTNEIGLSTQQVEKAGEELRSFMNRLSGQPKVPNANIEAKEKLELRPNVPPPPSVATPVYGTPTPTPTPAATSPLRAVPPPAPLPTVRTAPRPVTPQAAPPQSPQSKPLTREDLMNALGAKRTMAGDMERARGSHTPTQTTPPPAHTPVPPPPSSGIPPPPPPSSSPIPPPPPSSR